MTVKFKGTEYLTQIVEDNISMLIMHTKGNLNSTSNTFNSFICTVIYVLKQKCDQIYTP
jgi:hypothetical protein